MPVTFGGTPFFNPFDPFGVFTRPSGPTYPTQPKVTGPIDIKPLSSDKGMKITGGADSVTLKGTTNGPVPVGGREGPLYWYAKTVSFTLDIDKAPTKDVFGNTNYTEKNSRLFILTTEKGWSAEKSARMLAAKVNAEDDFKATVKVARDGSATISFVRR